MSVRGRLRVAVDASSRALQAGLSSFFKKNDAEMISFTFDPKKFGAVVAYFSKLKPEVTKNELCGLIFFADKAHLLRYGRPITGDKYFASEQGPMPTRGLDALNGSGRRPEDDTEVSKYGVLKGWTFESNDTPPDLKALSKSAIRVLDDVFKEMGGLPAGELEKRSHLEPAWKHANQNGPMDFELFFEGVEDTTLVKEILLEDYGKESCLTAR